MMVYSILLWRRQTPCMEKKSWLQPEGLFECEMFRGCVLRARKERAHIPKTFHRTPQERDTASRMGTWPPRPPQSPSISYLPPKARRGKQDSVIFHHETALRRYACPPVNPKVTRKLMRQNPQLPGIPGSRGQTPCDEGLSEAQGLAVHWFSSLENLWFSHASLPDSGPSLCLTLHVSPRAKPRIS